MELVADGDLTMLKITPPQTKDGRVGATKGAYCFVIDVSGSMNAAAEVTNDDGDRVSHGWSQLDIAKHATNTFITSLEDDDLVSVVTYSDGAKTLLEWTRCDAAGKTRAEQAVDSMRPERSTNLMAGINSGFQQMQQIPEPDTAMHEYALNLIIATDGIPSPQWHPARGRDGYLPLVKMNLKKLLGARGETSRCVLTTIGLGNQLDSELLLQMSNMFLHMPDPGSVGPFMVNLLANLRSTARLPDPAGGSAANHINLVVSPASAVDPASLVGYGKRAEVTTLPGIEGQVLAVELGSLTFDQPRHLVFKMSGAAEFTLTQHEKAVTKLSSAATPASDAQKLEIESQRLRLATVDAIEAAVADAAGNRAASVAAVVEQIKGSSAKDVAAAKALLQTLESEVLLGCNDANWRKWGQHYCRTFPLMLRAERRSNFRDQALQHFGKDAMGREALFEDQSNEAEMKFSTLKAPEPSLLAPRPAMGVPVAGTAGGAAYAVPRAAPAVLPDEFMRGGGCFAPDATVLKADPTADGGLRRVRTDEVRAGDALLTPGGRAARVRCVVLTECKGGRALLSQLPGGGPALTEWHPVIDATTGRWRFPNMLGTPVMRKCAHVVNFLLEGNAPEHVILVDGTPCVTLAHGLQGDVVAHEYWGTDAVVRDLERREGWAAGRVVMEAK